MCPCVREHGEQQRVPWQQRNYRKQRATVSSNTVYSKIFLHIYVFVTYAFGLTGVPLGPVIGHIHVLRIRTLVATVERLNSKHRSSLGLHVCSDLPQGRYLLKF